MIKIFNNAEAEETYLESKKSSHRSKSKKKTPKDQDDIGPSEPLKKHRSRSSKKNKETKINKRR